MICRADLIAFSSSLQCCPHGSLMSMRGASGYMMVSQHPACATAFIEDPSVYTCVIVSGYALMVSAGYLMVSPHPACSSAFIADPSVYTCVIVSGYALMVSAATACRTRSGCALVASFTTRCGCSDRLYVVVWIVCGATVVINLFSLLLCKL